MSARRRRRRGQGDRAPRRRPLVLRRVRLRRRLPPLGRADDHRRQVGSGQGLRDDHLAGRPVPKFMSIWRVAEAGDRAGPRLVRGRRQRHGALRRPRDRLRGRADRHALLAHVGRYLTGMWIYRLGLTEVKEFALTGRPLSGAEAAESGLINRRCRSSARGRGARGGRAPGEGPRLPAGGDEARGQPGLREHGPRLDPDARLRSSTA